MWAIAYVAMMRPGFAVSELLVVLMCAALFIAGWLAARTSSGPGGGWAGLKGGAATGAISAAVNLLLVGSLFEREDAIDLREAAGWILTLFGVSLFFAALGGVLGGRQAQTRARIHWPGAFAFVALAAMFLLIVSGGLVTGLGVGLAVPDWPNTFGHNMLLYPLSEMKEGVYFEHAHRLYGMLVGLTTLMLFLLLLRADDRVGVKALAGLIVLMVIAQGLMGALRVTGHFTSSMDVTQTRPSLAFAVAHGMFGQVTFAALAVLAALTTRSWLTCPTCPRGGLPASIGRDRALTVGLLLLLLLHIFLGVAYRQSRANLPEGESPPAWAFHGHLTLALVVIGWTILVAARARALKELLPRAAGLGGAILGILGLQVLLGIGALVAVLVWRTGLPPMGVALTTAHQAVGALLLAHVAMLAAWYFRDRSSEVAVVPAGQ
jgi:cytochrome c oxidase assembly protein subunit 15